MNNKILKNPDFGSWCFAIINGRLGEIYFDKNGKSKIHSHCYVKREEYSKKEQGMIDSGTKKYHFTWRNGKYAEKINT